MNGKFGCDLFELPSQNDFPVSQRISTRNMRTFKFRENDGKTDKAQKWSSRSVYKRIQTNIRVNQFAKFLNGSIH